MLHLTGTSSKGIPTLPLPDGGGTIPRIIHQTCARELLSPELMENVEALRDRNPGWEHRLYDDVAIRHFIEEEYGRDMLRYFDRIDPVYGAARADLFRYLLIYRVGGIYLDIKSTIRRPIKEVLNGDECFVVSRWRTEQGHPHSQFGIHQELSKLGVREIQQWHVIAAPGHPFLKAVIEQVLTGIDNYSARRMGVGRSGVLRVTGPVAYTKAITPILADYRCKILTNESELSLEYSIFDGMEHQDVPTHYSRKTAPVVVRRGLERLFDLAYVRARNEKRRLLGQEL